MHRKRNVVLRIRSILSVCMSLFHSLQMCSHESMLGVKALFWRWILMENNNNLLSFGLRCGDSVAILVCMGNVKDRQSGS